MPQIAQIVETYASQIFWLLVVFGLIYFVIGRGMLPRIEAVVDQRDQRIAGDLAAAEAARATADATEEAWRTRMATVRGDALAATNAAKSQGAIAAEVRVKAADAEAATRLAQAEAAILRAKDEAMASIEAAAAEAAQAMVAKLAGIDVDAASASGAVREAIAHG